MYVVESIQNAPGTRFSRGTRCSTPQKLTYRVPRSNWPLPDSCLSAPLVPSLSTAPRKLCNWNVSRFLRDPRCWQLTGVTTRGIILPLFPTVLSRRIRSRKRDRNWPLPRRHYAVLVGPFTAHTPCVYMLPHAKQSTIANKFQAPETRVGDLICVHLGHSEWKNWNKICYPYFTPQTL